MKLSNTMEQGPSREVNIFSATQEVGYIVCNSWIYYRVQK